MTGTLVELGKRGSQVGGETRIGGHLSETTRDFSEGLGPTRGRVSHHGDVLALITEVLSESDTSVDGGLSGGDRHVRGVGHEAGTLHNVILLAIDLSLQLREIVEHLSHLVAALTASDIDNTVRVGILGQGLGNTSLSAAEGAWDSARASLHSREEGIKHSLTSGQGVHWSELFSEGSGLTHGPEMRHLDLLLFAVGELDDGHALGDSVLAFGHNLNDCTIAFGGSHDNVLMEKIIFEDMTNLVTTSDDGAWLLIVIGHEGVQAVLVEVVQLDTAGHEDGSRDSSDGLEGSLNSVKDSLQNTCTRDYN